MLGSDPENGHARCDQRPTKGFLRSRSFKIACVLLCALFLALVTARWLSRRSAIRAICRTLEAIPYGLTLEEFRERLTNVPVVFGQCFGGPATYERARISMSDIDRHPELRKQQLSEPQISWLHLEIHNASLHRGSSRGRSGWNVYSFDLYEFIFLSDREGKCPLRYVRRDCLLRHTRYFASDDET